MIAGWVFMLSTSHPHDIAWFLFILGQSVARTPWIFRQLPTQRPPSRDWRHAPPLSSRRWGER
jgi:hypothetical protein